MELLRSQHWVVTYEEPLHLVRAARTPVPYGPVAEIERSMEDLLGASGRIERKGVKLLLDVREGPLRNDDGFERAMARYRPRLFGRFAAVAILVKTAVGKLQVTRLSREEHEDRAVFADEAAALAFLARAAASAK